MSSADQAARIVLVTQPQFAGMTITLHDTDLVGQAAWYEARAAGTGFNVVVRIGSGDCPAGCIDEQLWTYSVSRAGRITLMSHDERRPSDGTGFIGVSGLVTASPTCPVMRDPPDPQCEPRPIAGAVLVAMREGSEVARATSGADGRYALKLPDGHYRLVPQPVEGLMGTAPPVDFVVAGGAETDNVDYDTGIR